MTKVTTVMMLIWCGLIGIAKSHAKNLHLMDKDSTTGFEIYRTGKPTAEDMREWCARGISEIMVLSGNAEKVEEKLSKHCPTLKIIYNKKQDGHQALDSDFLAEFDQWVATSKASGKKIIFRCNCGCHRTGRLAAYYRMKYQKFTPESAIREMWDLGRGMFLHKDLKLQTYGLFDFIKGEKCTVNLKYCVRM